MGVTIDQIVGAKAYLGEMKRNSNPKTQKFWLWVQKDMVIINPETILAQLEAAKQKVQEAKKAKKEILIICEKSLYRKEIQELSEKNGYYYLNYKVPGWVLTNFDTLLSRIKSMNELEEYMASDEYQRLTKKEKLIKKRQLNKLEDVYKGVKSLRKKPELVIIVDGMFMAKFVDEVEKTKMDNIIMSNTNFDRRWNEDNLVLMNLNYYDALDVALKYILS